jgi:UDP-3-O-[3-hydroxymyristoyl] N-acetylglucosamine deacetylase
MELATTVDFQALGVVESASWDGERATFHPIARARTFGFAREAETLLARGLARGVDPKAVMVFDDQGNVMPPGEPRAPGELARHKLLDLIGDLYLYGGLASGRLAATRPSHAGNHAMMRTALQSGAVVLRDFT